MLDTSDKYCPSLYAESIRRSSMSRRSTIIQIDPVVDEIQKARVRGNCNYTIHQVHYKLSRIGQFVYIQLHLLPQLKCHDHDRSFTDIAHNPLYRI